MPPLRGKRRPRWNFTKGKKPATIQISVKVRTLADMSEDEIRALEATYGCPVHRPRRRAAPRRG